MPTKVWFSNYQNTGEQRMVDSMVNEAIRQFGVDVFYVPRNLTNLDPLLTEDAQSTYDRAILVAMYLKSNLGYQGDRNLMSKFAGLEIRDQLIMQLARTEFANEVGIPTGLERPREGDVVFFPLHKKCFVIRYVEAQQVFYQLGQLYSWDLTLELFEYSSEIFNTGIPDIDVLQTKFSLNVLDYALRDENGHVLVTETGAVITNEKFVMPSIDPLSQNEPIDGLAVDLDLYDFTTSYPDPFSEGKVGNR